MTDPRISEGLNICLPNILDDYLHFLNQGIAPDAIVKHLSPSVAEHNDISVTWAEEMIRFTLDKLGVESIR
jgi:hypothetical protein|tara:strand:+ start:363 stop:575 length:213 start_codon:yes stop_codon:yes gene_type:complete